MKTMTLTDSSSWQSMLDQSQGEELLLVRDGHAVALLLPFDDDDLEWYVRERDPAFLASIATARAQVAQGRTVSHNTLKREQQSD